MAMIGLLISILIPSLKRSMDLASATVCKHNLREIGYGLAMYRVDNNGWLPLAVLPGQDREETRRIVPWFVRLYPTYLSDPMVLTCPDDPYSYRMVRAGSRLDDPRVADFPSYGINSFIMTGGLGFLADADRRPPSRPHHVILVADIGPDNTVGGSQVAASSGPARNESLLAWDDGFDPFDGRPPLPWLTKRHDDGINVLTLTGGVQEVRTADIMRKPMAPYYEDCAAGGCTFCRDLHLPHYSFAREHLYWWTGPAPSE
jgi:hypothetical protein